MPNLCFKNVLWLLCKKGNIKVTYGFYARPYTYRRKGTISKVKKCKFCQEMFGSPSLPWQLQPFVISSRDILITECGFRNLGLKHHFTYNPSSCTSERWNPKILFGTIFQASDRLIGPASLLARPSMHKE